MLDMEQMYKMALDPRIFPDARLLAVLQGKDSSLPMAVAMSAKQQRDKLEQAKAGQQAQMGAKQPTVRDTMLAKDLPQPQAGLDQLPAPTMETMGVPGMAAGGIVAFGMGGFTDPDEDDDTTEQDELDSLMARQGDLGGLGAGIMSVANPAAAQYSSIGMQDKGVGTPKAGQASLLDYIMRKESGGRDYDEKGRPLTSNKGAKFAMQVLDSTAKNPGFGIKPAKDVSPEEYNRVGRELVGALHEKYKDPKLAAMAYNWGTGNVDKWLHKGADEKALPKETRMYVASLAQGGIVGFDEGGYTSFGDENPYDPNEPGIGTLLGNLTGHPLQRIKNSMLGVGLKSDQDIADQLAQKKKAANNMPSVNSITSSKMSGSQFELPKTQTGTNTDTTTNNDAPPITPAPDAGQDMITKYLAGLEQSRKQAPGLALMAAGLGIAGQRSPYGLSNIGAGGLQGLQSYEQAQKQDQSGQMAALSAQAALDRNKVYQQHYAMLGQQGQDVKYSQQLQGINAQIEKEIANSTIYKNSPQQAEAYRQRRMPELLKQNPKLYSWYQDQGGSPVASSVQLQNAPGNVIGSIKQ